MRRYWIPALFTSHLPKPDCPPVRVRLMGEDLVAFRDTEGRIGLLEALCAHRGAALFFGRNEECGLRCVYHGWKYDVFGRCVDMPSEPPENNFKDKIRLTAYPCKERGGIIWAYLGPPNLEPELPDLEWTLVPDAHRFSTRRLQECNWLQAMEGGIDSVHVPFLHRGAASNTYRPKAFPKYELVPTDYGFVVAHKGDEGDSTHWNVKHWLMPFYKLIAQLNKDAPVGGHAWVPIDDENCLTYAFEWHPDRPLTEEEVISCRQWGWIHAENLPASDRTVLNKKNDYLIDRELQQSGKSFTGIKGIGMQDTAIQESMGPVQDRTREHLGTSDIAIITIRKHLLEVLRRSKEGAEPPSLNPSPFRVRSMRFVTPKGLSLPEALAYQNSTASTR